MQDGDGDSFVRWITAARVDDMMIVHALVVVAPFIVAGGKNTIAILQVDAGKHAWFIGVTYADAPLAVAAVAYSAQVTACIDQGILDPMLLQ